MKRPAFQWYPGDWLRDLPLRSCSPIARAVWIDLLCFMHDGEPYGHLATKAGPITTAKLAPMMGFQKEPLDGVIAELEDAGVFSRDEHGAIYSRRMVRDEELRNVRAAHGEKGAEHGKKGGRPHKKPLDGVTPKTPSSGYAGNPPSSSSASSPAGIQKIPLPPSEGGPPKPKRTKPERIDLEALLALPENANLAPFAAGLREWATYKGSAFSATVARNTIATAKEWGLERFSAAVRHSITGTIKGLYEPPQPRGHQNGNLSFQNGKPWDERRAIQRLSSADPRVVELGVQELREHGIDPEVHRR